MAEREEQARRWQFEVDLMWGGLPPTERLRTVGGNKFTLAAMDRALLDAMAEATSASSETSPDGRRAVRATTPACPHSAGSGPPCMPSSGKRRCLHPSTTSTECGHCCWAKTSSSRRSWRRRKIQHHRCGRQQPPCPPCSPPSNSIRGTPLSTPSSVPRSPSATNTLSCSVSSGTPFPRSAARATRRRR